MQTNTPLMRSLAAIAIVAVSIWTLAEAEKVSPCCVAVSRTMENIPITGYRLQERNLPCIKAVIFLTDRGQFCIDPYQPWVKRKIVDIRRSQKNKMSPTSAPHPRLTSAPENSSVSAERRKLQTTAHFSE